MPISRLDLELVFTMLEKSMEKHRGGGGVGCERNPGVGKNSCEEEGVNDIATEKKSNVIFESFDKAEKGMMKLNLKKLCYLNKMSLELKQNS